MKMTSSDIRMCVITRKRCKKKDLIKITKEENVWKISEESYVGRSIYLLNEKDVIIKFLSIKKYKFKGFEMNDKLRMELDTYAQNL